MTPFQTRGKPTANKSPSIGRGVNVWKNVPCSWTTFSQAGPSSVHTHPQIICLPISVYQGVQNNHFLTPKIETFQDAGYFPTLADKHCLVSILAEKGVGLCVRGGSHENEGQGSLRTKPLQTITKYQQTIISIQSFPFNVIWLSEQSTIHSCISFSIFCAVLNVYTATWIWQAADSITQLPPQTLGCSGITKASLGYYYMY